MNHFINSRLPSYNNNPGTNNNTSHISVHNLRNDASAGWQNAAHYNQQDPNQMSSSYHATANNTSGSSCNTSSSGGGGGNQMFMQQQQQHQFWREESQSADPRSDGAGAMFGGQPNITVNPGAGEEAMNWGRKALHLHQESIL